MRTFGCKAYVCINKRHCGKLDNRAQEGIFVGYDNNSKGYCVYTKENKMVIARKVKFIKYSKINLKENSHADKNYFETAINNTFEESIMCK